MKGEYIRSDQTARKMEHGPVAKRMCLPVAGAKSVENPEYALLTEIFEKIVLDDTRRQGIISDDLMRSTAAEWRELQRMYVNVKFEGIPGESIKKSKARLIMLIKGRFKVTAVNLKACRIGPEGMLKLTKTLARCSHLQELNMACNALQMKGVSALCPVLCWCSTITSLDLSRNNIQSNGSSILGPALKHCQGLTSLDLSYNNIRDEGFFKVVDGLTTSLKKLNVEFNGIHGRARDDSYQMAMYDLCRDCTNLKDLNLGKNYISDIYGFALIKHARSLTRLDFSYNGFRFEGDEKGTKLFLQGASECSKLAFLDLSYNVIGPALKEIAEVLPLCTNLTSLNLSEAEIEDADSEYLANVLPHLPHLKFLSLENNLLSPAAVQKLREKWAHADDDLKVDDQHDIYSEYGSEYGSEYESD